MASRKLNKIYIKDYYSVAGPVEAKGSIKHYDFIVDNYYFGEKTFEQAEIKMQRVAIDSLLKKNKLNPSDISLLVSGDLSNQIGVSCYAAKHYSIPFFGIYSACASFIESLITSSLFLEKMRSGLALCVVSSHNLNSEKQFRFPIEYGVPRPLTTTFTATGAISSLVTREETPIMLESYTIGRVIDVGLKDATHMGAVMAPAAADTLVRHLEEMHRSIDYYDLVLTGDLGCIGSRIFQEYLKRSYGIEIPKYYDAGCELYLKSQKETFAGASGPTALPLYLFNKVLSSKKYKHILLLGTGSLHNPFFVNQKLSIPSVSHAISLEVNL